MPYEVAEELRHGIFIKLIGCLAFVFPLLCFWVPYSMPVLLGLLNALCLYRFRMDYFRIVFSIRALIPPMMLILWIGISSVWSVSLMDTLKLLLSVFMLFLGSVFAVSSIMRLSKNDASIIASRLFYGSFLGVGSLVFEEVSENLLFKVLGIYKKQNSYYNQGITLIIMFLPLFFHGRVKSLIAASVYIFMVFASTFFDYDAGRLALYIIPLLVVLLWWKPVGFMKFISGVVIATVLCGPFIPKYVLNYDMLNNHFNFNSRDSDPSWVHRLRMWSYTAKKISDKPILGWGGNASRNKCFHELDYWVVCNKDVVSNKIEEKKTPSISLHPHNITLQIWLELGFVGAMVLAIIFLSLYRFLIKNIAKEVFKSYSVVLMVGTLFAHLSYGMWQSWWLAALGFVFIWGAALRSQGELKHV